MHILDQHARDQRLSRPSPHDSDDILPNGMLEDLVLVRPRNRVGNVVHVEKEVNTEWSLPQVLERCDMKDTQAALMKGPRICRSKAYAFRTVKTTPTADGTSVMLVKADINRMIDCATLSPLLHDSENESGHIRRDPS